jgi:polyhydroxyalkanoate synthesis regulator phasin
MLEQVRNAIELASGLVEVPRRRAEQFARSLADRGELRPNQISSLVEDILRRSKENAQMVQAVVSSEVRRQVKALGLATRDDVERLNRRIFSLAKGDDLDRLIRRIEKIESKLETAPRRPAKSPASVKAKTTTKKKAGSTKPEGSPS